METITSFNIPAESKLWVYQSSVLFSSEQLNVIQNELEVFVTDWASHGTALKGYFEIIESRFIVLAVDEQMQEATGCSIDKSVSVIKKIEILLGLNLTDRGLVLYQSDGNIKSVDFREIKEVIASGQLTPDTIIYNVSITKFGDLVDKWKILANDSWLKRYFN